MLVNVFNAGDTAPLAIEAILEAGSLDAGPKGETDRRSGGMDEGKNRRTCGTIDSDKGPEGDFED